MAADCITPDAVNFMARHGRGLICLALTAERCDELGLPMMTERNRTPFGTAFTVSIEASAGASTGISAADRAHTIQVAVDPASRAGRPRPAGARVPAARAARTACWSAPARPRPPSISRGWPGSRRPA